MVRPAAPRIDAVFVVLIDTRRATCVGFLMCDFFDFHSHLPRFVAPEIDQLSKRAPGSGSVEQGEESDSSKTAVGDGGEADE